MFLHVVVVLRTHIHAWEESTETHAYANAHTQMKPGTVNRSVDVLTEMQPVRLLNVFLTAV